jgi:benzoyl-CoA reductase subunit C
LDMRLDETVKALQSLGEVATNRHEYALQWKRKTGSPVFGCFGDYVPEEIIYATGILPVRIFGSHSPAYSADPHISPDKWCPFSRGCLAEALSGKYNYIDGIVSGLSCFHLQQSFDSWIKHLSPSWGFYLDTPFYIQNKLSGECFTQETRRFIASLEKYKGGKISGKSLEKAIQLYNSNRQLLRTIYESRKAASPPVSGVQAMEMVMAGMLMDKEEHNDLISKLVGPVSGEEHKSNLKPRIMVIGAETDDLEIIKVIESLDAEVVIDSHSLGTRYFWNDVLPAVSPVSAIALRYINKIPMPQMDFPKYRHAEFCLKLAKEYNVKGVIIFINIHCDPFQWDVPVLSQLFQENQIQIMPLQLDALTPSVQTRNRIEAFIEMLKAEQL